MGPRGGHELARSDTVNRTVIVGTEGASFYLFHHVDLAHRLNAPGDGLTDEPERAR